VPYSRFSKAALTLSAPRHIAETDSVAGHIGFELRCAERIFISLRNRRGLDLRKPVETVAHPRRIIFSAGLFARAFVERRTQRARSFSTSEFESSQAAVSHIATLPQYRAVRDAVAYCDTAASIAQCEMQSHAAT
jgi:hypothetical protein